MSQVKKYVKKAIPVEAILFDTVKAVAEDRLAPFEAEWSALEEFTNHLVRKNGALAKSNQKFYVFDRLHNTWVEFYPGDYIIKGTEGEFYPHNGELFGKNYTPVPPTVTLPTWPVGVRTTISPSTGSSGTLIN